MDEFIRVYRQSAEQAKAQEELPLYHESRNLNAECATDIDDLIQAANYELYRYDLKSALEAAVDAYGAERVSYVIAATIKDSEHDGRYSHANKEWAKDFGVIDEKYKGFNLNTHPAILDGFAQRLRELLHEKPELNWNNTYDKEQAFINSTENAVAIYQIKSGEEHRDYRFERLARLQEQGLSVDRSNYNLIYTAPIPNDGAEIPAILRNLYQQFNVDKPTTFYGLSLSVSDVIALNIDGEISSHYVDSFGFEQQPEFLRDVETAELSDKDLFFLDEENGTVTWMYYNPDSSEGGQIVTNSSEGGQIVTNELTFHDVLNAAEAKDNPEVFFDEYLGAVATQYLSDVGTEHFYSARQQFVSGTHQLSGLTLDTVSVLSQKAENYLATLEKSTEQNFNMIDGVRNNMPPAKTEKPSVIEKLREARDSVSDTAEHSAPKKNKEDDLCL